MLNVIQIVLAITLVILIVLQAKGSGLGSAFGGGADYHTKRGTEKTLYIGTIVLSFLFVLVAFFNSLGG
jgi:preprotein translocase subunit SecG